MDNQKKPAADDSPTESTPPQTKTGQMRHNFKFPADLKWGKSSSSGNFSRSRRSGDSSSSSIPPQRRAAVSVSGDPSHQSPLMKYIYGQNPIAAAASGPSRSLGSTPQHLSLANISDKESTVIDMLSSCFMTEQKSEGENPERFSETLPSPRAMVEQFKKGLIGSDKKGRSERKGLNVYKKRTVKAKSEGGPVPRTDKGKELVTEDLEVAQRIKVEKQPARGYEEKKELDIHEKKSGKVRVKGVPVPSIHKGAEAMEENSEAEKSAKMDDKETVKGLSSNDHHGQDEDMKKVITGEYGDSEGAPWKLRPRKPNQMPKIPKPCEAVGSSAKLGAKSVSEGKKKNPEVSEGKKKMPEVSEGKKKMPEIVCNNNSDTKKGKGKDHKNKDKRDKGKEKPKEKVSNVPIVPKFSVSLTPEEIEEDLYTMTGQRPSRKFKRRDKAVQDTLDQLFPGMQLKDVTLNDYKTSD